MTTDNAWEFEDCIVIEDIDCFEVVVTRNDITGHQSIVPGSMDECRKALDEGEDPLWSWEDGAGMVVGYAMKADREDLAYYVRHSEYYGGVATDEGDEFQYRLDDGRKLVVITSESFPEDADDEEIIKAAESFAIVDKDEAIPSRWDTGILFEVE